MKFRNGFCFLFVIFFLVAQHKKSSLKHSTTKPNKFPVSQTFAQCCVIGLWINNNKKYTYSLVWCKVLCGGFFTTAELRSFAVVVHDCNTIELVFGLPYRRPFTITKKKKKHVTESDKRRFSWEHPPDVWANNKEKPQRGT